MRQAGSTEPFTPPPDRGVLQGRLINLLHTVGMVELRSGGGSDKIQSAFERAKRVLGEEDRDYLAIAVTHCDAFNQNGRAAEAEVFIRRMLPVAQRVLGKSAKTTMFLHTSYVDSLSHLGKFSQAKSVLKDLLQRGAESSQNKQMSLLLAADSANALSDAWVVRDPEKALQLLGDILFEIDRRGAEPHDAIANAMDTLGLWQLELGKTEAAEAALSRASSYAKQVLVPNSYQSLSNEDSLARVLLDQGQVVLAERKSRHAVSLGIKNLDSIDRDILIWVAQLIDTLSVQGEIDRLEPGNVKALAVQLNATPKQELIASTAWTFDPLEAFVRWQEVSPTDRRTELLTVLTKRVDLVGRNYPPLLDLLARMQALNGEVSMAADTLQRALSLEVGGPFRTRMELRSVGYLRKLGRHQEADIVLSSLRTRLATDLDDHRLSIVDELIELSLLVLAPNDVPLLQSISRQLNYVAKHYDSKDHDDIVPLIVFRAKVLLDQGEYKPAKAILARCLTIRQLILPQMTHEPPRLSQC